MTLARGGSGPTGSDSSVGISREIRRSWAETYSSTRYDQLPWFSARPASWIERGVQQGWLRKRGGHLDVGCGAGTNVLWLTARGFVATGVDLAPGAIAAARRRASRTRGGSRARFVVGDALALPFPEGAYETASDIGCFHSLPPQRRRDYARELSRVLVPGGRLLLSWVAREATQERGPPHRPSVLEVANALEERFLFQLLEFRDARPGRDELRTYSVVLRRRAEPQPPPR
ncbi:MAG: class I SAM-dependent methyltransferase [Euryarchaeota archaeon]|nr:class I SAM-dependent methyltransferase [Euryarchaeota archaeon]MDE2045906.1 class I SAM-dependent methyltransferase [Thermoplasmata archaeon]